MPDNPALRNAHRRAADVGRRAAANAGARPTSVSVVVEAYTGTVGDAGVTLASTSTLTIEPPPRVRSQASVNSYFGGGTAAASSGVLLADQYEVGPITLAYPGGGYTDEQLCPAAGDDRVVYYLLSGDAFATGGERFRLVNADASRAHQVSLVVERTSQAST